MTENNGIPTHFDDRSEERLLTTCLRAATLGFVGGLRSLTPLTLLDWTKETTPEREGSGVEAVLSSPATRFLTTALAIGELVGDKLPFVPSRLKPAPLMGRAVLGAQAGIGICRRYNQPPIFGAVLGAAGATVGSYAGSYFRTSLAKKFHIPGPLLGVVEDGIAIGLGGLAVKEHEKDV